jgi:hypothetical protein
VVAQHDLVLALEDVVADEVRRLDFEAQLLAHLAHDRGARVLARSRKPVTSAKKPSGQRRLRARMISPSCSTNAPTAGMGLPQCT